MAGVERYLETGKRFGRGKTALYLGTDGVSEGMALAVTAAYAVLATALNGRTESPTTALDNLEIKLPFLRSDLLQQQSLWENMLREPFDSCMTRALGTMYRRLMHSTQTLMIDSHYVAEASGAAGMTDGIRRVTRGSMIFNSANPLQLAMLMYRKQNETAHSAVCAKNGGKFYLFDCDMGVFAATDEEFPLLIREYHRVQNIRESVVGSIMRI